MAAVVGLGERWSMYRARAKRWRAAMLGDPVARVLSLPRGRPGFDRYEDVRKIGNLVRGRDGLYMTASYRTCDVMLRSADFGAVPTGVSRGDRAHVVHPLDHSFPSMDPPEHTRLRKVVAPWFSPQALREQRPLVERIVTRNLDLLDKHRYADLIGEFALRVPSEVICELLELPIDDHDLFTWWGTEFGALVDGARTPRELRRTLALLAEMADYFGDVLDQRQEAPGTGVLSELARASADGRMSRTAALATAESLLIGGFITTVSIIGTATRAVLSDPGQRDAFLSNQDQAANLVEESLRFDAPAQYCVRVVKQHTSLDGQELAPGSPVIALLAGANRDPEVFTEPDRFDIARPNARDHLSFAAGIHYCVGAGLARMEAEIALRGLFERFPSLRLAGPARYGASRVIRGPSLLPVRPR